MGVVLCEEGFVCGLSWGEGEGEGWVCVVDKVLGYFEVGGCVDCVGWDGE